MSTLSPISLVVSIFAEEYVRLLYAMMAGCITLGVVVCTKRWMMELKKL